MTNPHFTKLPLPAPNRIDNIPESAQWLSGEGAGSWCYIKETNENSVFEITRFSPEGKIECAGNFKCQNAKNFKLDNDYFFTHLSHCVRVNIVKSGFIFTFERI